MTLPRFSEVVEETEEMKEATTLSSATEESIVHQAMGIIRRGFLNG